MGVEPKIGVYTPKWMVYNGKPYSNGWFGGKHPYFWKHPYETLSNLNPCLLPSDFHALFPSAWIVSTRLSAGGLPPPQLHRSIHLCKTYRTSRRNVQFPQVLNGASSKNIRKNPNCLDTELGAYNQKCIKAINLLRNITLFRCWYQGTS